MLGAPASAPRLAVTLIVRRWPDGSCVEVADVPGFFWAVTPKGTRLRDAETRLVVLYRTTGGAASDLAALGYAKGVTITAARRLAHPLSCRMLCRVADELLLPVPDRARLERIETYLTERVRR